MKSTNQLLPITDSKSMGKKEFGIEASGDHLTAPLIQKKALASDLEVTLKTPWNLNQKMSQFPPSIKWKNWIPQSQILQCSSPLILTNPESPLTNNLHALWEQWLRLLQPQLSQAPSLDPLDLQYPPELEPQQEESGKVLRKTLRVVQAIKEKSRTQIQVMEEILESREVEAILEDQEMR